MEGGVVGGGGGGWWGGGLSEGGPIRGVGSFLMVTAGRVALRLMCMRAVSLSP